MIELSASALILLASVYLLGLAVVALVAPERARAFLHGFAGSAFKHYAELCIRMILGAAFLIYGAQMRFPGVFTAFGWILVVTTLALCAVPWRWHHRFAQWSVPMATRNLPLFALGSFAGGAFVLLSILLGPGFDPSL